MLSIVIVTRNTRDILDGLLSSIEADASLRPDMAEVVVVDNGSQDGTDSLIAEKYSLVTYVRNEENRGFAAAVNVGYRRASADLVLFLNSDTRLIPGEMTKILRFMESEPRVGIVGPQLVYEDMRPQRSYAVIPSLVLELIPGSVLQAVFPQRFRTKGKGALGPTDVESVIGAGLMARREVLDAVGGFDERFFFFLEETDLCLAASKAGYRVVFFPGSKLVHLQGKTVKQSWIEGRIEYSISLYKFIGKHHSAAYHRAFAIVRGIKALLFLLITTVMPFLLISSSIRRKYSYYSRLVAWHVKGCPDDAGLRPGVGPRRLKR
jgi:GT2 family glycosyltransferase